MFNHFIQNMCLRHPQETTQGYDFSNISSELVDTPLPNFYELFDERILNRLESSQKNLEKNYKSAVNKKVKMLKTKLRELIN
jgi:hypothetical protein